jgi:RNA ligase
MSTYFKYPRTMHLPWSLGRSDDDKVLTSVCHFDGKEVVVSEKLDGECTSMYRDKIHARSVDSKHHPSRTMVKVEHSRIQHEIPQGWRICGENVYARHSLHYKGLTTYFYVFAIYNHDNVCLSWDETIDYANFFGLHMVPVLYRGVWNEEKVKACYTRQSAFDAEQEGYIVRTAAAFPNAAFSSHVAKFVRAEHVTTGPDWLSQTVVRNLLKNCGATRISAG